MNSRAAVIVAAILVAAPAQSALAQDPGRPATFGGTALDAGFLPDPASFNVTAGGSIDAYTAISTDCVGSIANAPDFELTYAAGSYPLYIFVESGSDTTLVVNAPNGNWYCDDDRAGDLNPMVLFTSPDSGTYDIWVGTYSGGTAGATLLISELGTDSSASPSLAGPDPGLPATFGDRTLDTGFAPDPAFVRLTAGGGNSASQALGNNCTGYIAGAPDLELRYSAGTLPLYIFALSDADTTIVANDPDGLWHCDDDSGEGMNPALLFSSPRSGTYDIWVGTYEPELAAATLGISEMGVSGETLFSDGPDWRLPATWGTVSLNSGFSPDPWRVELEAGGDIDPRESLGDVSCTGYIRRAPDFQLSYRAAGQIPMSIGASSATDTVLVVNAPDGTWQCNDDGGEGFDPLVEYAAAQAGVYYIWVGTWLSGPAAAATLTISDAAGDTVPTGAGDIVLSPAE